MSEAAYTSCKVSLNVERPTNTSLTSDLVREVVTSSESKTSLTVEKCSPPARPILILSQNRISPRVETSFEDDAPVVPMRTKRPGRVGDGPGVSALLQRSPRSVLVKAPHGFATRDGSLVSARPLERPEACTSLIVMAVVLE